MKTHFHWTDIISLNSSQNDAFEELLCQLAKKEAIEKKKNFIILKMQPIYKRITKKVL